MPCTILVAADLWGVKVNYEIPFPSPPTASELQAKVENVFAPEHALRRPTEIPPQPFTIERMQTFDERAQQWVDLISAAQLQDFSQVYVFQKETDYHREVQSKIPPPVPAPAPRSLSIAPASAPVPSPRATAAPSPARVAIPTSYSHATPPPLASSAVSPPADTVPHSEKTRVVFDELDVRRSRAVELEDFKTVFHRLRLDFSTTTVADLFVKADINKDSVVTFDEWQRFAELYPTLLDSLYYRGKDYWVDAKQQQDIEASKRRLDDLREREKEARMTCMQAQAETSGQEQKLAMQAAASQEAQAREKDAKAVMEAAHEDTERGRNELRDRVLELQQQKERERQKQVSLMEAQREVEVQQKKLQSQEAEAAKAEELLREMERRVLEQRREVDRLHAASDRCRGELAAAQSSEHMANIMLGEAKKETQVATDRVTMAETEVASRQEREREATACYRESQNDSARQLAKRDLEERELHACKERESVKRALEAEAMKAVEEQERKTQSLEQENMELNIKRRQVEEEERGLLEQEVRLREQRDSLEEKEQMLRMSQRTFHTQHGRGGTAADSVIAEGSPKASPFRASPARASALALPLAARSSSPRTTALGATYEPVPAPSSLPLPRGYSPAR